MAQTLLKGSPRRGLTGATIGFFIGFAAVALYGSTSALLKSSFSGINPILLALLVSAPSLSGSILRIPFSAWVDTTGGRKPFIVLLVLSIIGMSGLAAVMTFATAHLGQYYALLFFLALLSGCGIATFSVGISQTSYWYPLKRQGSALGIYAGVGNIAPGIFMILVPNLAIPLWGLSGSYVAWLIFLIVGTVIYILVGQNAWYFQLTAKGMNPTEAKETAATQYGQELFPNGKTSTSLILSAKSWQTWALVLVYFTTFGGFMALTSWLPTYWSSFFKLSIKYAGLLTALYSIVTSITRALIGKVADQYGGEKIAAWFLGVSAVGAFCMIFSQSIVVSILGVLLLAVGMGTVTAAVFKIVSSVVPHAIGGASGWIGGLGAFGGFVIPPLMASFIRGNDTSGYSYGFFIFIALIALSLLMIALIVRRTGPTAQQMKPQNARKI